MEKRGTSRGGSLLGISWEREGRSGGHIGKVPKVVRAEEGATEKV